MEESNPTLFGYAPGGIAFLSPADARDWLEREAVLVDLRRPYETLHRTLDVPETLFLPWPEFEERQGELPLDRPLVLMDNVGLRSQRLYPLVKALGAQRVAVLSGGVLAWIDAGLPVTRNPDYALNGQCSCRLRPRKPYAKGDTGPGQHRS